MREPVGFDLSGLRIDFSLTGTNEESLMKQLILTVDSKTVYDSGKIRYENNYFDIPIALKPRTYYGVQIIVSGRKSAKAATFFETGKMNEKWTAKWIANDNKNLQNTLFKRDFSLADKIKSARLYITGLGLYEVYLNTKKVGEEYLTPGVTAYNKWVEVQTYDVTNMLKTQNRLIISTGDGWYKGKIGYNGGKTNIYGDRQMAIAELHIKYMDGHEQIINTDSSWQTTSGRITRAGIYYGEDYDATIEIKGWQTVVVLDQDTSVLKDRLSLPATAHENLTPIKLIHTPKGEAVLDFGQNHAGTLRFYNREPKGTKLTFQFGEILQGGNFYRGNLREARATYTYVSNGQEGWVQPHFTYFGFRYVKVSGNTKPLKLDDYLAPVLYSNMKLTGNIKTDNRLVNQLFKNIQWGQKSNFVDIPTDSPQRDERLPWTGDANIFSSTATFNMNVYEFFKKYARDMAIEQDEHHGMLTFYAPKMGVDNGGAAAWADAATMIPWNMYWVYGDPAILKQNYREMKGWVDWITRKTKVPNLWVGGFQFGDWLALDGNGYGLPSGRTDENYIASIYYYVSTKIVTATAKLLGEDKDEKKYRQQAQDILQAIRDEYITKTGRLAIDTQTGYALALYFNIVPENEKSRLVKDFVSRLHKDNDHLTTGFVGTPFVNRALSENGYHKLAVKIFMQEDFPSWLYAVKLGATTIWERWNSVEPDGLMNPDGMNSLNHYSYGAIMEWAYRYVLGIRGSQNGYQTIEFAPLFDYRLKHVKGHYDSSYGRFSVEYQIETDKKHTIKLKLAVPYGTTVNVDLPRAKRININGQEYENNLKLTVGQYEISYVPTDDYVECYDESTSLRMIMNDKKLVAKIDKVSNALKTFEKDPNSVKGARGNMTLATINGINPAVNISDEEFAKINKILTTTPLKDEREQLNNN